MKRKNLLAITAIILFFATPAMSKTIKVSDIGFDEKDSTLFLQKALDSGAEKVIIDNVGKDWITNTLFIPSDIEVVFAKGVKLKALKGAFKNRSDSLITLRNSENVIIRGEGDVVLSMNKKDYQNPDLYVWSEWRMLIALRGTKNVKISNLKLLSSGGDGIYIASGSKRKGSDDTIIDNVICEDNHRQGLSVISAKNLLIKNSSFNTTSGTPPTAGIDFEPNKIYDYVINCVLDNCTFEGNESRGLIIHVPYFTTESMPISITIKNCKILNNNYGISIYSSRTTPVKGEINFENCEVIGNKLSPLNIVNQQEDGIKINIKDTLFDSSASKGATFSFINQVQSNFAGVNFDNVSLIPNKSAIFSFEAMTGYGIVDVSGSIKLLDGNRKPTGKDAPLAQLIDKNKPNAELQKSFIVSSYEPTSYKALNPNAKDIAKNSIRGRGKFSFVQYVSEAGDYEIDFKTHQIGKSAVNVKVQVTDQNGTDVDLFNIKESGVYTYKFTANGQNFYKFDILTGAHTTIVNSNTPGCGFLANVRLSLFRSGKYLAYFTVLENTEDINVEFVGTVGEAISARLISPEQKSVASISKNQSIKVLSFKRPANSPREVWSIYVDAVEDHKIRLGAGIIPVLSTKKELVLTK